MAQIARKSDFLTGPNTFNVGNTIVLVEYWSPLSDPRTFGCGLWGEDWVVGGGGPLEQDISAFHSPCAGLVAPS